MPIIPVLNPPRRKRASKRSKSVAKKRKKKKRSVARKKRKAAKPKRKAAKKAAPKKKRKKRKTKKAPGEHRPRITVRKGRIYRGIGKKKKRGSRSMLKPKQRFANPLLGEIAALGNPPKRRKKAMAKKKKSRKGKRRRRRNPAGILAVGQRQVKGLVNVQTAIDASWAVGGFLVPETVMAGFIPVQFQDTQLKRYATKVGVIAATTWATQQFVSKKAAKLVMLGGAMSLVLDLYQAWVLPMLMGIVPGTEAAEAGVSMYHGNESDIGPAGMAPQLGHYYGLVGGSAANGAVADAFAGDAGTY